MNGTFFHTLSERRSMSQRNETVIDGSMAYENYVPCHSSANEWLSAFVCRSHLITDYGLISMKH